MGLLQIWRDEKAADRAVILEGLATLRTAFDAQAAQAKALTAFLDSFKVDARPEYREWDEGESVRRYLDSKQILPPELRDLPPAEQFQALLDHMDEA